MIETKQKNAEEMAAFFNQRAGGYDNHMRSAVRNLPGFYRSMADQIAATDEELKILDLGCGTGLELRPLFRRAPQARVTGIDLSEEMLSVLRKKYRSYLGRLDLILGSYETVALPESFHDYVISAMSLHHFKAPRKKRLYEKIRNTLRPGGLFINGDYFVSPEEERKFLERHDQFLTDSGLSVSVLYHIDIPFCLDRELQILKEAGFIDCDVIWKSGSAGIVTGRRP